MSRLGSQWEHLGQWHLLVSANRSSGPPTQALCPPPPPPFTIRCKNKHFSFSPRILFVCLIGKLSVIYDSVSYVCRYRCILRWIRRKWNTLARVSRLNDIISSLNFLSHILCKSGAGVSRNISLSPSQTNILTVIVIKLEKSRDSFFCPGYKHFCLWLNLSI